MPTYLCHGFRWDRQSIVFFTVLHNIDDAAAGWVVRRGTPDALLPAIQACHPYVPSRLLDPARGTLGLPMLELLEEYSLTDTATWATPYAYLADHVVEVGASVDLADAVARYETRPRRGEQGWFERLRDELLGARDARIAWYVVVCEDEEREFGRGVPGGTAPIRQQDHELARRSVEDASGNGHQALGDDGRPAPSRGEDEHEHEHEHEHEGQSPSPKPSQQAEPRRGLRAMRSGLNLRGMLPLGGRRKKKKREPEEQAKDRG